MKVVCISGGFDPIHEGHVNLIEHAAKYGNLVVILNSDDWLLRKKGYNVMSWHSRARILAAMRHVAYVANVNDDDGTVCDALRRIKPDFFANGGDRTQDNTPELILCKEMGIKPLFGIGGEKVASSSKIVKAPVPKAIFDENIIIEHDRVHNG